MTRRAGENRFPLWLRAWLDEHRDAGWTQARIAQVMGITAPQVASWVSRTSPRRPEYATLQKLSHVLGEPLEELLTAAGYIEPPDLTALAASYTADIYEYARKLRDLPPEKRSVAEQLIDVLRDPSTRALPGSTGARVLVAA